VELLMEPSPGFEPVAPDSTFIDPERNGDIVFFQSGKEAHFNDLGLTRTDLSQFAEEIVDFNGVAEVDIRDGERFIEQGSRDAGAPALSVAAARVVDEDAAHQLGR
jgi:hypothetical protein